MIQSGVFLSLLYLGAFILCWRSSGGPGGATTIHTIPVNLSRFLFFPFSCLDGIPILAALALVT